MNGADRFAREIRPPLNTTLDFQPCHLDVYPTANLDEFFAALRMRISTWLRRKRIGTYWVWTRENYEGKRREHLHIVLHLPPRYRGELENHIRGLPPYKGDAYLVQVGERTSVRCPVTGRWTDGLAYRMKQLRGDAVGAQGPTASPGKPRAATTALPWLRSMVSGAASRTPSPSRPSSNGGSLARSTSPRQRP
jgi:hypothetical protein